MYPCLNIAKGNNRMRPVALLSSWQPKFRNAGALPNPDDLQANCHKYKSSGYIHPRQWLSKTPLQWRSALPPRGLVAPRFQYQVPQGNRSDYGTAPELQGNTQPLFGIFRSKGITEMICADLQPGHRRRHNILIEL